MSISVVASPVRLTWDDFILCTAVVDPIDNSRVSALTRFKYEIPVATAPRTVDGKQAYPLNFTITVTPDCKRAAGTIKTDKLLAHEQMHYDVGIMVVRAFARKLHKLRAADLADLVAQTDAARELHLVRREGLLQGRIDQDTRHGANAHYEDVWQKLIATGVGNPNTSVVNGYYV